MSEQVWLDEADDEEAEARNDKAEADGKRGFWFRRMDGDVVWCEAPDHERCGGSGSMHCYCGGDFCVCGNQGEIECMGCVDCEPNDVDDDDMDYDPIMGSRIE
jgi:hypothetical protein